MLAKLIASAAFGAAGATLLLPIIKRALAKSKLKGPLTLSYFGIPGPGEPVRMLLALSGKEWINQDMAGADGSWAKLKPKTKWGQMPLIETSDGKQLTQSVAMARLLAKLITINGKPLYPEDPHLAFAVDEFVDALQDMRAKFSATFAIADVTEKAEARKKLMTGDGAAAALWTKLEAAAGETYAVGDHMSLADVWVGFVVGMVSSGFMDGLSADLLEPYPKLLAIAKKVYALPELKAYYTERAAAKPMYKCFIV